MNGVFFKMVENWEDVLIFFNIIPLILALIGLFTLIEETPFDLILNYSAS